MTGSNGLLLPKSVFVNSAIKYNTHLTEQEKALLTGDALYRTYQANLPGTLFMPIDDVLGPLAGAPFPVGDDLIHFIYRSAQVKRCIDFRLQAELGTFSEYYFDNYDSEAADAEGYRHFTSKVHDQMRRAELAVYNAVYMLTLRHQYQDDLVFPYEFVQRADEETGVFALISSPVLTDADFNYYGSMKAA